MKTRKMCSMTSRKARLTFAILAALIIAGIGASAAQQTGPVYSMEGAWYGLARLPRASGQNPPNSGFQRG